jgi:hypothetical protein
MAVFINYNMPLTRSLNIQWIEKKEYLCNQIDKVCHNVCQHVAKIVYNLLTLIVIILESK